RDAAIAPAVSGAVTIGPLRAAEIGGGEQRDLVGHAELEGGAIECVHRLRNLRQQIGVRAGQRRAADELSGVQIPPAKLNEEYLALEAERGGSRDEALDHHELVSGGGDGEDSRSWRVGVVADV